MRESPLKRSKSSMKKYVVMEYLYRDADNYKAFGKILLSGNVTESYVAEIESFLNSGEFFVAEQVGIPTLYSQLWEFSNGPTRADHAFHEFLEFCPATDSEIKTVDSWGTTDSLLEAFRDVRHEWDCSLSVHAELF